MQGFSRKKIIITGCLLCIVLTLYAKNLIHTSTNPEWHQPSSQHQVLRKGGDRVTIHFHERRPFYMAFGQEARGVVATPTSQAFTYADIPFSWQQTPVTRQLDIIRSNMDRSCAVGWFKTAERETFARYSLPIYRDKPFVAITRSNNDLLGSVETLDRVFRERRLKALVKEGYSYGPYIDEHLKRLQPRMISTTADNLSMMKMIQAYRADYYFVTEIEAEDQILFSGLKRSDFKLVHFDDMPAGNLRYIICSKMVEEETIGQLNQAIRYLTSSEEYDQ